TGARQVGKTTLARALYGERYRYLNLDSPGERSRLAAVAAETWGRVVGEAVLDEAQKQPAVLEKLKWAYDAGAVDFSVVLGSSRITLLEQVKESLAGRVFLFELWPLTAAELVAHFGGEPPRRPWIAALLQGESAPTAGLVGEAAAAARAAVDHLLAWGGMPPLLQYPEEERLAWLEAYQATYLERDLSDLARLRDLEPFTTCHRLAALRAGRILSYADLARDAGLAVSTVRRYLRYLELSYQTFRLPAWSGNPTVRLVKSPKLIWWDLGIQRCLSGQTRELTGEQYENAIVAQVLITLRSLGLRVVPSYLRTAGGLEVDLVLEGEAGMVALEVKARPRVEMRDARPLARARRILGDRLRLGLVVYRGDQVVELGEGLYAIPDWLLLAGEAAPPEPKSSARSP
ncbi:MAG: ATP-binding protein, partial [Nitrospirae bacterium]